MDSTMYIPAVGMKQLEMMRQKAKEKVHTTAPLDSRFPNQNQTRYCYQMFLDYHRCVKKRGENYEPCNYFKKNYIALCPDFWLEKWQDQMDAGAFPGRI